MALAAALYLWQLGSSSLFVDEVPTHRFIRGDLGDLFDGVARGETSPPTYWLVLNLWNELFGSSEDWIPRLLSVVFAVALVGVVYRLGVLLGGRWAGIAAGLLTALSPLVLGYAQQARQYALLMLVATFAVLALVEAEQRGSRRWLIAAGVAACGAVSLHYVALLVVGPLCAWVLLRSSFGLRARAVFCAVPALVFFAWVPLMLHQYDLHPNGGLGEFGELSRGHAVRVTGSPFDIRTADEATIVQILGALVVMAAAGVLAWRLVRERRRDHELVLLIAVAAPLGLLAAGIAGKDMVATRYAAVAVPTMIVMIGVAIAAAPRVPRAALVAAALVAAVLGTVRTHQEDGLFPDARGAMETIASDWREGDAVVDQSGSFGVDLPLMFYATRELPPGAPVVAASDPRAERLTADGRRVWIVTSDPTPALARANHLPAGRRLAMARHFPDGPGITLIRAE
ncbi:MAG TPA: glycosyltransferase family 39 protein [Thermoleophilaceae bacterium]|jgi:mannosyltransferase